VTAQKKYESAQQRFYAASTESDQHTKAEVQMGLAVTEWDAKQPELALSHYRSAVMERKAWANPQWTVALYGTAVSATIRSIQHENDIRARASGPSR